MAHDDKSELINATEPARFAFDPYNIQAELVFIERSLFAEPKPGMSQKRRRILPNRPLAVCVETGNYGVVMKGRSHTDRDGLDEVYLGGEVILMDDYDLEEKVEIAQLRANPGIIQLLINQDIAGLTIDENDLAHVKMVMRLALKDPKRFLALFPYNPQSPPSNQQVTSQVMTFVTSKVNEFLLSNAGLWSNPNFYDVVSEFVKKVNFVLEPFGLQIDDNFVAYKSYPVGLRDLVIEYRMVEKYLLDQIANNRFDIAMIGLSPEDFSAIKSKSKHYGDGAGLFELSIREMTTAGNISNWLSTLSARPFEIIQFLLKRANEKEINPAQLEFTRHLILAAFRSPMLAFGEWADIENEAL